MKKLSLRFHYYKTGEKNFVKHHLDIFVDGESHANYESAKKTDLSPVVYEFYELLGIKVKPVFDGVDFPDCEATLDQIRTLTARLSDFRVWKKKPA